MKTDFEDWLADCCTGWFPLKSKKWLDKGGKKDSQDLGEIELEMRWFYEEGWDEGWNEPRQTALQQLTENSNETKLRLGNIDKVKTMLNNVPIIFRFHRVAIRNTRFYLKDLFRGGKGEAEKRMAKQLDATGARYLEVKHIDWKTLFRPRKGDPGECWLPFSKSCYLGLDQWICRNNNGNVLRTILPHRTSEPRQR